MKVSFSHVFISLVLSAFCHSSPAGIGALFHSGFDLQFPITNNAEHLFLYYSEQCLFEEISIQIMCLFLIGLFFFLLGRGLLKHLEPVGVPTFAEGLFMCVGMNSVL